VTDFMGMN